MKFTKMCGAGNDFIVIENFDGALSREEIPTLAQKLCRRHFSVGADGLMVLEPPQNGGDCRMLFYNNDGTTAEMCGNGARCLCRYCVDHGLSGERPRIETPAGLVTGERLAPDCYRIRLNSPRNLRQNVKPGCDYLELGEPGIPHAVFCADFSRSRDELREQARALRHDPAFPRGANVNLYQLTGENELRLLTFERGVEDFTLACGTGNGATVAALTLRGLVSGRQTRVQNDGGILTVDYDPAENALLLTGGADAVFEGTTISII